MNMLNISRHNTQKRKTHSQYKPVTTNEMKAFVGVILNMVIIPLQNLQDYWSTNPTSSIPFFRSVFNGDRFFQICWMLHVDEIITCTRNKDKIELFIDLLVTII